MRRKLFSIKARSFKEFIEILKKEKCEVVNAEIVRKRKSKYKWLEWMEDIGGSFVDVFEYSIELSSRTPTGKKVIYRKAFLAKQEKLWSPDICDITMQLLLAAEKKLKEIKKEIPSVSTALVDQEGPILKKRYKSFRDCAKKIEK